MPLVMPQSATLHVGDAKETLASLPAGSVQTCVTSPPYWGLRDYGEDGQLGLEETPDAYVENLVEVFREVRRVLRENGTLWLNLGDSYASQNNRQVGDKQSVGADKQRHGRKQASSVRKGGVRGLKQKDLVGIPWRVALALQDDGWWLRSDIIWHKPNPMPESVTDRPTSSHEHIFLLSPSKQYFYEDEAVREEAEYPDDKRKPYAPGQVDHRGDGHDRGGGKEGYISRQGRNKRDVWTVSTKPYPEAHFAVYPPQLIEPCIKAGTSKKGQCPECGAPWDRVVEWEEGEPDSYKSSRFDTGKTNGHMKGRAQEGERTTRVPSDEWRPTCGCNRAGEDLRDDAFEVIESPLSSRSEEDPTMKTGRRGMNRPRSEDEGKRRITRAKQRRYAEKLKHSPHRSKMEDEVGVSTFEHYIRKDTSGARPVPVDILAEWKRKGWVDEPQMPDIQPYNPEPQTVLDPFSGAGTTGLVALAKGRDFVGIDLSAEYCEMAADRIREDAPLLNNVQIQRHE